MVGGAVLLVDFSVCWLSTWSTIWSIGSGVSPMVKSIHLKGRCIFMYTKYMCVYKYIYIYVMSILYLDSTSCHFIRSFVLASLLVILTWHIGTWLLAGKVGSL